jgi:DUF1016 N-terminal domain
MSEVTHHTDYRQALAAIKQRIQSSQTRAVLAVNAELLGLYWDIGRQLDAWQRERAWGSAVVEQMAQDLLASYPGMKGFSRTSLFAMRQFYVFFSPQFEVVPQPVGQHSHSLYKYLQLFVISNLDQLQSGAAGHGVGLHRQGVLRGGPQGSGLPDHEGIPALLAGQREWIRQHGRFRYVAGDRTNRPWITLRANRGVRSLGTSSESSWRSRAHQ